MQRFAPSINTIQANSGRVSYWAFREFQFSYTVNPILVYSHRNYGVLVDYGLLPEQSLVKDSNEEVIQAVPRPYSGKIISKKERKSGRCPSIVYEQTNGHLGGNKELISVDSQQILRLLKKHGRSFFLSKLFDLDISEGDYVKRERVLPRQVHLHAGNDRLLNVTFLKAQQNSRIKVDVPIVFIGSDACAGIRKGGFLNTIKRTVRLECPGTNILPFVEVDLSSLEIGEKVLLKDLPVGPDVRILTRDVDLPVCKIGGRTSTKAATT